MSFPSTPPARREFLRQVAGFTTAGATALRCTSSAAAALENARAPVIDCHVHLGTAHQMIVPWNTVGDPEEILRNMRKGNIDQSVIFPMTNPNWQHSFELAMRWCMTEQLSAELKDRILRGRRERAFACGNSMS